MLQAMNSSVRAVEARGEAHYAPLTGDYLSLIG